MENPISEQPLWTKDFVGTALANFFVFISYQMLIPVLPVYVEQRGGHEFTVGLVVGLYTLTALLTRPFAGKALDTLGRRRVVFVGLILFLLSVMSYHWLTSILLILLIRAIHGVGWGISTTSLGTIVSDLIPVKRRGEGMGYFGLSGNMAMALGPVIGLWLMETWGFGVLFAIATLFSLLSILLARIVRTKEPNGQGRVPLKPTFWQSLIEKSALLPAVFVLFLGVTYGGILSFITLYGKEIGISQVGLFFLANAGMIVLVRPFAGKLFDKTGHGWVLLLGGISSLLGVLLLSYAQSLGLFVVAALFYGAGFGTVQPSLQAWVINRAAPERRGAANGTYFSFFDMGIGLGSMVLGLVANATSFAIMYRLSDLMLVFYVLLYLGYLVKTKRSRRS